MTNEEATKNLKKLKSFHNGSYGTAIEMAIKALEQQPSEPRTNLAETSQDCVSIEPIQWYSQNKDGYLVKGAYSKDEAYVKLTDVYEKIRTSEDCISRQAVIDYAKDTCFDLDKYEDTEVFCDEIKALPSVTPERPKGKWLHIYKSDIACECSVCHIQMPITEYFHYCPNCGANMSGGEEDEDRKSL